MVIDLIPGSKHYRLVGHLGSASRVIGIASRGGKALGGSPTRTRNYRRSVRRELLELRRLALPALLPGE